MRTEGIKQDLDRKIGLSALRSKLFCNENKIDEKRNPREKRSLTKHREYQRALCLKNLFVLK